MAPELSRLLSSAVLEVVAGIDDKLFRIHGELLASHSENLWWQVNNSFCSDDDRRIVFEGHDGPTVGRFAEFLYTGDYHAPGPVMISDIHRKGATQDSPPPRPEIVPAKDTTAPKCETKLPYPAEVNTNSSHPELETSELCNPPRLDMPPVYDVPEGQTLELPATNPPYTSENSTLTPEDTPETVSQQALPETRPDKASHFDRAEFGFRDVFLAHGKICALAHSLGVEPLEELSIVKLDEVFRKIASTTPGTQMVSNFAELVDYAYKDSTSKKLREALLKFFSHNFSVLRGLEPHRLTIRGGDLASDLMKVVWEKMEDSEQENGQLLLEVKKLDSRLNFIAEKDQEHAEAQAELGGPLGRVWKALHLEICGQGKDLSVIQQELKEALEMVEKERCEKEIWMASLYEYKGLVEDLRNQKGMLLIENDAIKKDLERAKRRKASSRLKVGV